MADKLEPELTWSDHEKPQTWVLRYTEVPKVGRDGKTRMVRMETGLWRYCFSHHKQRWLGTKRHKGPPLTYNGEKGIGWWFPTIWTEEFKKSGTIGAAVPVRHPTNPIAEADWKREFPGLKAMSGWSLPTGTIFVAADATVVYPNGVVEGWASAQRLVGKQAAPEPSKPEKPLTEEVAVSPSPELVEILKRKEWLRKREEEGEPPPSDPDAWRSEMASTGDT